MFLFGSSRPFVVILYVYPLKHSYYILIISSINFASIEAAHSVHSGLNC